MIKSLVVILLGLAGVWYAMTLVMPRTPAPKPCDLREMIRRDASDDDVIGVISYPDRQQVVRFRWKVGALPTKLDDSL